MNRLLIKLGAWLFFGLVASLVLTWHFAFRHPVRNLLPLPPDLVALGSPAGQAYLEESEYVADFQALSHSFVPQIRREFSGVATAVTVLNALFAPAAPLTQVTFFTDPVRRVRSSVRVSLSGMSLIHLRDALREHGAAANATYASASDLESFRSLAKENLGREGDYLVVDYARGVLRQRGAGNIAPAAAYHAPSDRILVLDAAIANYPPVWVRTDSLWRAMEATDGHAPFGRGFVVVQEPSH